MSSETMLTDFSEQHQTRTASKGASLQPILSLYAKSLIETDNIITEKAGSVSVLIPKVATHLLQAGGKRVRALLLLASADLALQFQLKNQDRLPEQVLPEQVLNLAAAVELIHTATLLHDDVVDNSVMRRGRQTANQIWDNKLPILVGDYLFSRSFELMVQSGSLAVLEILSQTSAILAEGEVLQLQHEGNPDLDQEIYRQIIDAKTASLFSAACRAGAELACDDRALIDDLAEFGRHFGLSFQMVDDIMDYHSDAGDMGKIKGDDLREGKVTLPFILLKQRLANEEQDWLEQLIRGAKQTGEIAPKDFAKLTDLLSEHQIFESARQIAFDEIEQAEAILQNLKSRATQSPNVDKINDILAALDAALQFSAVRIY